MTTEYRRTHQDWNDTLDECGACGATRKEVDDNLAPTCRPITGPHRLALIALYREHLALTRRAEGLRSAITRCEDSISHLTRDLREAADRERDLAAAIAVLKAAP